MQCGSACYSEESVPAASAELESANYLDPYHHALISTFCDDIMMRQVMFGDGRVGVNIS